MFRVESDKCRFCREKIEEVRNLGSLYSCGIFPSTTTQKVDSGYLAIGICVKCELVQLLEDYDHTKLYTESYGYRSSLNESMVAHLSTIAEEVSDYLCKSNENEKINHLDIGSNDATLLNQVRKKCELRGASINQLGVDPSGNGFRKYYQYSELVVEPFHDALAQELESKYQVISSIAMFYDLPDPIDFVKGIKHALHENGIWISEQSYFFRMIEQNAFDTICQEHLEYYTITDIVNFCNSVGLELFDVKFNDINGGSFRFYVQHKNGKNNKTQRLDLALQKESVKNKRTSLEQMFTKVDTLKANLLAYLIDCKDRGLEVHGYGASTKGNTLLQFFGITPDLLSCIAERNEDKFGKYTPGTLIPIVSESESRERNPHVYLVLPWHFRSAILAREADYIRATNVKFVFPLPEMEIV